MDDTWASETQNIDIKYFNNKFISATEGNTPRYSTDGITWTEYNSNWTGEYPILKALAFVV